ncbi:MAG: alpha/beta hydrolase [Actinomycetota bacterium]|nr:alpha/beta hydrolase [Actinomycetota bacterium]
MLLHGFPQSSYEWRHLLPVLAEAGFRALAPDQRGYSPGARPEEVEAYHVDQLVADALAIADHLGWARFHLIGHDWGAVVGWTIAARHPERLRTLTVLSVPHPLAYVQALGSESGDQASRSRYIGLLQQEELAERLLLAGECAGLRALFANTAFHDRPAMDHYVERLCDPAALTAVLNWYRALDLASIAGVGPVAVPTLYVWSTDDPAIGPEAAERTEYHMAGPYRFEVLEGVSHWIPEDVPDQLGPLVLEHLRLAQ